MAEKIKSVKDLKRLPSGNFLDIRTRVVYAKSMIEKEFAEELATITETAKPKAEAKAKAKPKPDVKAKAKSKTKK